MVLGDGMMGQMMEPVEFKEVKEICLKKHGATVGTKERKPNVINSLFIKPADYEKHNIDLFKSMRKLKRMKYRLNLQSEFAEIVFVAYGTTARIVKNAINSLAKKELK